MTPAANPSEPARTGAVANLAKEGKKTAEEPMAVAAAAAMTSPKALPLLEDFKSSVSDMDVVADVSVLK